MILLLLACASDPAPPSPVTASPVGQGADEPAPASSSGTVPSAGTAPTGGTAPEAPKVETMLGDVPGVQFVGEWTSTGCEGRAYARNLRFFENGEYAGIDLVSPCPPSVTCMWSGMVAFAGIWKQEGTRLLLREIGAPTAPGSPHPTEVVASYDGKLVENGCFYTPGLTVPDGYTEDQVRPKLPGSQ